MHFSLLLLLASATVAVSGYFSELTQQDLDIAQGQLIDHHGITLLRHLGSGGMGAVFAATYSNGSSLAVKLSRSRSSEDEAWISAAGIEMYCLEKTSHPTVVEYQGSCLIRFPAYDILAIFTELLGPNLHKLLARDDAANGLGASVVYRLALQTSEGLAYLHTQFIAHHDIKTLNLVMDGELDPTQDLKLQLSKANFKIIDLSLCEFYQSQDVLEPIPNGTPLYFSPEKANAAGRPFNPFLADAYALGYALVEALLGPQLQAAMLRKVQEETRLAPSRITITEIYQAYRNLLPDSMKNLPLIRLIANLVEADPAKRMTIIEFNRQLKRQ